MQLVVECSATPPLAEQAVEVVERKGLGHPDTLCDAVAEEASLALCRFYRERFGMVLHHNVDKVLLVGGQSRPRFGGGEVLEPIEIYLAGRATTEVRGAVVPVPELVTESCRSWLQANLRHLNVERDVRLHVRIRPGSADLSELFMRQRELPDAEWLANDSSCGVGFAPATPLEALVLSTERALRAPAALAEHPERGEDLKLMGVRHGAALQLTVSDAFVGRHVSSLDDYRDKRAALRADVQRMTGLHDVSVNAADDLERGSVFLTVTGTSAEAGDDGEAGRGNRINGLITPYRPMTMESAAGKNPVTHVGKTYNITAQRIASALVAEIDGVQGAQCCLVSRIGQPVKDPQLAHVRLWLAPRVRQAQVEHAVRALLEEHLNGIDRLCDEVLARRALVL
jgi:S-adenosylmethionine synthetase